MLDVSTGLLDCFDHDPAQANRNDFVGISVKVPNGKGSIFFRPLFFASPAYGSDCSELAGELGCRRPSAESSLTESGQVDSTRIDGVVSNEFVHQAGNDFRFPP